MSNVVPGSVPSAVSNNAASAAPVAATGSQLEGKPVVAAGSVPAPKKAPTLAELKAARAAKLETDAGQSGNDQAPGTVAKPGTPGTEPGKDAKGQADASDTDGSGKGKDGKDEQKPEDKTLTQFVGLRKDLEKANARWKEHEPVIELGKKYKAAQELAAKGKHYDAILAMGFDFDHAAAEVMQIEPDKGQDPVIAELKANQERLEKELKDERDKEAQTKAEADKEQGRVAVRAWVKERNQKFPLLSRNDAWIDKALKSADDAYGKVVAKLDRDLEPEEKQALIETALLEGEKYRVAQRKLYLDGQEQTKDDKGQDQNNPTTITGDVRGGTNGRPQVMGKMTLEQLRARRLAAMRQ